MASIRVVLALPLYLFDWLCYLVAFAAKPYEPGLEPRLGGGRSADRLFTVPADHDAPWQSEATGELDVMHRSLIVLRPKQPYVQWARRIEPTHSDYTLAQARREDAFAFLVPSVNLEAQEAQEFLQDHWQHFFAQALESWSHDAAAWPKQRSLAMLREWFDIEISVFIVDLGQYADAGDEAAEQADAPAPVDPSIRKSLAQPLSR